MQGEGTSDQGGWPWRTVGGVVGLIALLAIMTMAQSNFQEEDAEANQVLSGGAFGYADPQGRRVLAPVETALARGMKRFSKVVVAPGRVADVTFVEARRAGDAVNGRQAPDTFDDTAGAVFAVGEGLPGGAEALVATERFLAERRVLPVTPLGQPDCAPEVASALASRSARPVLWCKDLAGVGDGGRLSLARLAPRGREELVTLAYNGPGGPVYFEYPGDADPSGTWRTGDAGEFPAESVRPLFAFATRAGLELAVRWSGPDGEAMDLLRQEGQTFAPFVATTWARAND